MEKTQREIPKLDDLPTIPALSLMQGLEDEEDTWRFIVKLKGVETEKQFFVKLAEWYDGPEVFEE